MRAPMKPALRDGIALAFTSFFPLGLTFLYFVVLDSPEGATARTAFLAGKLIQFMFPLVYVAWFERERIRLPRLAARGLLAGAGFGIVVGVLVFVLYYTWIRHLPGVAEKMQEMIRQKLRQFRCDSATGYLLLTLFYAIPHSLL